MLNAFRDTQMLAGSTQNTMTYATNGMDMSNTTEPKSSLIEELFPGMSLRDLSGAYLALDTASQAFNAVTPMQSPCTSHHHRPFRRQTRGHRDRPLLDSTGQLTGPPCPTSLSSQATSWL